MNGRSLCGRMLYGSSIAFVLSLLLLWAGTAVAGQFDDGVAAYDQGQFEKALELWLPLAQQGNVAAQFNLAALYERGLGVAKSPVDAARWYLEAAKQGDLDAQLKIAALYEEGVGVAKDVGDARKWYEAVLSSQQTTRQAAVAKDKARTRLAAIAGVAQQVVKFDSGRYVIVRGVTDACVIALQGAITMDTAFKFDRVVEASRAMGCNKPVLMLESPGGLTEGGIRIGMKVRDQEMQTATRYDCASACGFIFMGGVQRVLVGSRARIGLHQPATVTTGSRHCSVGSDANGVLQVKHYIAGVVPETSSEIMKVMMNTSCDSITWVNGEQSIALGVATRVEAEGTDVFGPKGATR
jgi:hypothetical protein